MNCRRAEFDFITHRVVYLIHQIFVYESVEGEWKIVAEYANVWRQSEGLERQTVAGRMSKPEHDDAKGILDRYLRKGE